jgi:hypothetical protein
MLASQAGGSAKHSRLPTAQNFRVRIDRELTPDPIFSLCRAGAIHAAARKGLSS